MSGTRIAVLYCSGRGPHVTQKAPFVCSKRCTQAVIGGLFQRLVGSSTTLYVSARIASAMRGIRALQRLQGLSSIAPTSVLQRLDSWAATLTTVTSLKDVLKEKIPAEQVLPLLTRGAAVPDVSHFVPYANLNCVLRLSNSRMQSMSVQHPSCSLCLLYLFCV